MTLHLTVTRRVVVVHGSGPEPIVFDHEDFYRDMVSGKMPNAQAMRRLYDEARQRRRAEVLEKHKAMKKPRRQ